jgi:protein-S-isoprenylcysteine O-methyltransferase Ste14
MNGLLPRAVLAFLVLPGTVGFVVPLLLIAPRTPMTVGPALVPVTTGIFVLLWCVRDFYVAGRGTLAPWAPPRRLVRTGLYRFSRNPMYVGVLSILVGWATGFRSWPLAVYAALVALAFHLRVVLYEEPTLARSFGREWEQYRVQVPRWLGAQRHGSTARG